MQELPLVEPEGIRIVPDHPTGVGVLTIAGSSGRIEHQRTRLLARNGALAESIRWFGGPGQHPAPYAIGLETFITRIDALTAECDRIVLMGTSFGAEAVLVTACHDHRVDAVVAFAPSDVVWAGVDPDGRQRAHWTYRGEELPFVPYVSDWQPDDHPPSYRDLYRESRDAAPERAAEAAIPVELIKEPLLVAGGDDRVWDSVDHARRIAARRSAHGRPTKIIDHPRAGHRTVLPGEEIPSGGQVMARGGTEFHDRQLGLLAWPRIAELIRGAARS